MRRLLTLTLLLALPNAGRADFVVAPPALTAVEGNSASLFNIAATVQMLYTQASTGLSVGDTITGFAFRINAGSGTNPALNFSDFEVYLGPSAVATLAGNSSFAANQGAGTVQVRDGALAVAAGAFPSGGAPNAFGPVITFDTPYVYTGGSLLLTYTKTLGGGATITDADVSANSTGVQLAFTDSYQATIVDPLNVYNPGSLPLQFQFTPAAVPEPSSLALGLVGSMVALAVRLRRRSV